MQLSQAYKSWKHLPGSPFCSMPVPFDSHAAYSSFKPLHMFAGVKRKHSPARDNDAYLLQLLSQGVPSCNPDLSLIRWFTPPPPPPLNFSAPLFSRSPFLITDGYSSTTMPSEFTPRGGGREGI